MDKIDDGVTIDIYFRAESILKMLKLEKEVMPQLLGPVCVCFKNFTLSTG